MESAQRTSKLQWIILFILSLFVGALGFCMSYKDEQTRFSELSTIAESHLIYALQLKDDMALIDWSKRLEQLPSVLAFQAHSGSKIVAQGGNQEMCSVISNDGFSFDFPYRWIVHSTFNKESSTSADLTIVFQDFQGPLIWALFLFSICLLTGLTISILRRMSEIKPITDVSSTPAVKNLKAQPNFPEIDEKNLILVLDADYIIFQVTQLAAKELGQSVSDLIGNHFLDLLPDPILMKVIAEAKESKFLKPFPSQPHLSMLIRPQNERTILTLEVNNVIQRV